MVEYTEFDLNDPNYEFSMRSDSRELGDISFYDAIINRQRILCYDNYRQRAAAVINTTTATNTIDAVLNSSITKLLATPETTQKHLLIFNEVGLDRRAEDVLCSQYAGAFDLAAPPHLLPTPPPASPPDGGDTQLPEPPAYVEINDNFRLIIDWTQSVWDPEVGDDVSPVISIDEYVLIDSGVPQNEDTGEFIFPTRFCGTRITHASSIFWDQFGQLLLILHSLLYHQLMH